MWYTSWGGAQLTLWTTDLETLTPLTAPVLTLTDYTPPPELGGILILCYNTVVSGC